MVQESERILVFQIASLGDTIVSVPVYREIARRHPNARRYLLTNFPPTGKWVAAESILAPMGLIDGTVEYPMPLRSAAAALRLRNTIRKMRPTKLYYLLSETKSANLIRHFAFFKACGISRIEGIPWSRDLRFPREVVMGHLWESEASRLLRSIGAKADPGPPNEIDRSLRLTSEETSKITAYLGEKCHSGRFVAISVGGKVPVNNWGDCNWRRLLTNLSSSIPELGAVFIGSADERTRNENLAGSWSGPKLNACGLFAPRETAALVERASLFIGHDTGTLHLAAAVNTPIVGIFSARNLPGKWFSDRARDNFFFRKVDCMACELVEIEECPYDRKCINGISPDEIVIAAQNVLLGANVEH